MLEAQLLRNWQKATIISKAAVENIVNTSETSFPPNTVTEDRKMESNGNEGSAAVEINKVQPLAMEKNTKDLLSTRQNQDQLKLAEAEMGEVKEENERLKMLLGRIAKDYQSLQMHFFDVLQQEEAKSTDTISNHPAKEEPDLVSLSLGMTSTDDLAKKHDKKKSMNLSNGGQEDEKLNGQLSLRLDCSFEPSSNEDRKNNIASSNNSFEELKEEEPTAIWPPSKILKTARSSGDDEVLQQNPLKKARVSVRARCDTPTMNDGCQWRKYGQKIAKGNPCPRGYYRCTVSSSCPVRKQVQRCVDDMSILITTYEGTHNHPLPISATAMASTTSAAASMLQSRSSSSSQLGGLGTSATAPLSTSTANNLHGFNFSTVSQNSRPPQFYIPNSSFSTSNSHPTVTLDLTTAPSTSSSFGRFSSTPRYPSTRLNFSSSSLDQPNTLQNHRINGDYPGYSNYGYNSNTSTTGNQPFQEHLYQANYMNNQNNGFHHDQPPALEENIVAATKAIASNPKFHSILAAALTSYVGDSRENQGVGDQISSSLMKLKWDDHSRTVNHIYPSSVQNVIGCGSSYLNKSSPSINSPQQGGGGLALFPPNPLQLSASKGASTAPADNRDHFQL